MGTREKISPLRRGPSSVEMTEGERRPPSVEMTEGAGRAGGGALVCEDELGDGRGGAGLEAEEIDPGRQKRNDE
jgi:hypothetical protein